MQLPQNKVFLNPLASDAIWQYQQIERQNSSISMERYDLVPRTNVFQLRDSDILSLRPQDDVRLEKNANGLQVSAGEECIVVDPGSLDLIEAILAKGGSPLTLSELESALADRWQPATIKRLCEQLLGVCIETPHTIDALEKALPLNGLLRFPVHSPYKLPRTYWENAIAVRAMLPFLYQACDSKDGFLKALAGLHRIATVGENGDNIYVGAGGIATVPGGYREENIDTKVFRWHLQTIEWWLKFLKVPVKLVKEGSIKSIGKQTMVDIKMDGIQCVHWHNTHGVVVSKLLDEARTNLQSAIRSSKKGDVEIMLGQLGRFLQLFALAHPFNNINASIAMNIVNDMLGQRELGILPHLYLDYVAQRTRPSDFSLVFKAVFEQHRFSAAGNREIAYTNMRRLLDTAAAFIKADKTGGG